MDGKPLLKWDEKWGENPPFKETSIYSEPTTCNNKSFSLAKCFPWICGAAQAESHPFKSMFAAASEVPEADWYVGGGGLNMFVIGTSILIWMVVSNIFYFHPYLGKWSNLTNIFQRGWNHQVVIFESLEKMGGHDAYYKVVHFFLRFCSSWGIRDPFPDLKATRPTEIRAGWFPWVERQHCRRQESASPTWFEFWTFLPFLTNTHPKMWAMFTTLVTFDWIWLVYRVPDNGIV